MGPTEYLRGDAFVYLCHLKSITFVLIPCTPDLQVLVAEIVHGKMPLLSHSKRICALYMCVDNNRFVMKQTSAEQYMACVFLCKNESDVPNRIYNLLASYSHQQWSVY